MARKTEPQPRPEQRMIDAALALAARQGWRRTSLAEIAAEAGLPIHQAYAAFRSKAAILEAFSRRIDRATLEGAEANAGEAPRDRLFDTILRRFDALAPHKPALRALASEPAADPLAALCGGATLLRSMRWMLEASGIGTASLLGRARVPLLVGLYLSVLRIWLEDESPDLARTMAVLDRRLRRAAPLLGLSGSASRQTAAGATRSPAAPDGAATMPRA